MMIYFALPIGVELSCGLITTLRACRRVYLLHLPTFGIYRSRFPFMFSSCLQLPSCYVKDYSSIAEMKTAPRP